MGGGWEGDGPGEANTNIKPMFVQSFVYLCCYCDAGYVNSAYSEFFIPPYTVQINKRREFSPATVVRELWFNLKCIAQIRRRTGMGGGARTQTLNKQCVFNYLCVCLVIANATPTRSALRSGRKSLEENETAQPLHALM